MKMGKKELIKLVSGVSVFLLLIIGATYAYFLVPTSSNFNTITGRASTEEIGNVSLASTNANLSLDMKVVNFAKRDGDVIYYASNDGLTTVETKENIGVATATGNGNYNCHYTMRVSKSSTDNKDLYEAFQNMSTKSEGQIILTIDDQEFDFNTANLFNNFTYNGTIRGVNVYHQGYIKAGLYVVDKHDVLQNELNDKNITLSFNVTSFSCDATGIGGRYILANNNLKTNLSNTPLNDLLGENTLYRYQGVNSVVNNNCICFGTSDKNACTTNTEKYMYRILGIAEDGTMKLIKNEAMNSSGNATKQWNNKSAEADCVVNGVDICTWPDSTLYSGINGSYYLTNTSTVYVPTGWADKIQTVNWKYGNITTSSGYSADASFTRENAWTDTVNAKIGLMYIYDYYYANGWDGTQNYAEEGETPVRYGTDGWIHRSHTDGNVPNNWEWLLSRYGLYSDGHYNAWAVAPSGSSSIYWLNNTYSVRPVFYLVSDVNIIGEGTINSPYIITD